MTNQDDILGEKDGSPFRKEFDNDDGSYKNANGNTSVVVMDPLSEVNQFHIEKDKNHENLQWSRKCEKRSKTQKKKQNF